MAKDCDTTFLLNHGGTEQRQRLQLSLDPVNLDLNDLSMEDWMRFAYTFAKEVNYFSGNDHENPEGNWQSFFIEKDALFEFINDIEESTSLTPHLTLFICFLKLIDLSKSRFNEITERHLDFYYKKILQIEKKAPIADSVHLIFELAKNISEAKIEEGTSLEAGKDPVGKRLQYKTDALKVINKTSVASIKSIYHHRKRNSSEYSGLFSASAVNSADGKGEPFKEDASWLPFGYPTFFNTDIPLETPTLGFSIASPTLALKEGNREIKVKITLGSNISTFDITTLAPAISIYATGEKGWLGPFSSSAETTNNFTSVIGNKTLQFSIEIDKAEEPIIAYNKDVHGEHFDTTLPVFRFLIDTEKKGSPNTGYKLYTELLEKVVSKIEVSVHVSDAEELLVQNDLGDMPADKPFFPFTTQPMERSAFYIDYPEAFAKNWEEINIAASWLNTPIDFKQHYFAYRKDDSNSNLSPRLYYQTLYHTYDSASKTYSASPVAGEIKVAIDDPTNLYIDSHEDFDAKVYIEEKEILVDTANDVALFTPDEEQFNLKLTVSNNNYEIGENGPLKLSLKQSFLHSIFPKIYALALTAEKDTIIPNTPYTPLIEKITLSYSATQEIEFGDTIKATDNLDTIQLFHEHPFGQSENQNTIVPTYCSGGELYIGLEKSKKLQQVSLLFQILEGTENPQAESFSEKEGITWAILIDNNWLTLTNDNLIEDATDNFLKTGIVTIAIPREANENNTLLPEGYVWLRAKSTKSFDAVCKFIDIHTQVITAAFNDNNNDLAHLETGLESGTISKLTERDALVKKVAQPYNSFGGSPEEISAAYYQRVSERIRHKDRAITLWDYEHLILEEFKDVYKVKCLNHTKDENYHSAGNVSLVVIPDIVNKNAFDIFQPRVSTAKRNEIQDYINAHNTFFVSSEVINPNYEEVRVKLGVKFNKGYDENYYTKELKEDIKKYLSPWAYKETSDLNFGVTFHKSKLIAYLEQLEYIDYLDTVILSHKKKPGGTYKQKTNIVPSSPKAILVSAKDHDIIPLLSKCLTPNATPETICLP